MNLLEWAAAYIDYLNQFKNNLIDKTASGNEIICTYKFIGKCIYLVSEHLGPELIKKLSSARIVLVCYNSPENVNYLAKNWNEFTNKNLKIIFVNPDINMQWSIMPDVHDKICDKSNLRQGLLSLFESVPPVDYSKAF